MSKKNLVLEQRDKVMFGYCLPAKEVYSKQLLNEN